MQAFLGLRAVVRNVEQRRDPNSEKLSPAPLRRGFFSCRRHAHRVESNRCLGRSTKAQEIAEFTGEGKDFARTAFSSDLGAICSTTVPGGCTVLPMSSSAFADRVLIRLGCLVLEAIQYVNLPSSRFDAR